ncbi:YmdB family metallophosphoesterase [Rubripirellula sp.]|nr:TIGR00282 family metallophosphoesterase [Rubripirellula sp.]MDB4338856.1 YmdB family metallophosphoesterase [Rubripirellula sp.]
MKLLFLGDIVGKPGLSAVLSAIPELRKELELDAVVVNAENAADGSGLMPRQFKQLIGCGIDAVTMGDHIYRRKEITEVLNSSDRIVKPANFPEAAPGRSWTTVSTEKGKIAVTSVLGRVYMNPVDCPFNALDRVIEEIGESAKYILVDIHAEATGDKQLLGRHLDGRVTAALGTHTHVPTDDATILPKGTAFQCDVGMCGPHDSILGRSVAPVLAVKTTFQPQHFHVATDDVRLCGAIIEASEDGTATSIKRFERKIT